MPEWGVGLDIDVCITSLILMAWLIAVYGIQLIYVIYNVQTKNIANTIRCDYRSGNRTRLS